MGFQVETGLGPVLKRLSWKVRSYLEQ
jgi:hypothetical protein